MTREEAIESLRNFAEHAYPNEEFLMGIKALEQEPKTDNQVKPEIDRVKTELEDYISRAEAIESIRHAQINFSVESDIDFTKHKREVQEIVDGILNAQIKALGKLPSVKPQEPKTDTWSIKDVADALEKHGFGRLEQEPSRSPDPIITIDGIRYIAEEPKLKTVHKDGEVVIGGFKEIV